MYSHVERVALKGGDYLTGGGAEGFLRPSNTSTPTCLLEWLATSFHIFHQRRAATRVCKKLDCEAKGEEAPDKKWVWSTQ